MHATDKKYHGALAKNGHGKPLGRLKIKLS